jgi:hypothetical protein
MELYGSKVSNADVIAGKIPAPKAAEGLAAVLNKYSSRKTK